MSADHEARRVTNDQPAQGEPEGAVHIARSITAKAQWLQRVLSPWVGRWLPTRAETGQGRHVARYSRTALSATHTSSLLNRVQRVVDRGTVWRADVGSLEPALVDRFTRTIVERFPDVSAKYEPQPLETNATPASDLILAGSPPGPDLEAEPEEEMGGAEFSPRPTVAEMRAMWEARQGHSHPPSAIPDQAPRRIQRTRWPSEPEEESESVEPPARPTMAEMRAMWESKQAGSHQSPSTSDQAPSQVQRAAAEPARSEHAPRNLPPGTRRFSRVEELSPGPRTSALHPAPIDVEQPQPQPESPPVTPPDRPVVQRQPAGEMPSPETPLPEEGAPGPEMPTAPLAEPEPESPRPAVQRQPAEEVPAPEPPAREEAAPDVEAPAPSLAEPAPELPPRLVSREVSPQRPAVQGQPAPEPTPLVEEAAPGAETPTPPLAQPAPEPPPRLVGREVSGDRPAVQRQPAEEMPAPEPTPLVEEAAPGAETPTPPAAEPAPEPPPRLASREVSPQRPAVQRQPAPEPTPLVEEAAAPGAETPTLPVAEPAPEPPPRLLSREVSGEPPAVQRQPASEPTPLVEETAAPGAETPTPPLVEPGPEPPRPVVSQEVSPERPGAAPAVQRQPGEEMLFAEPSATEEAAPAVEAPTPPRPPASQEMSGEPPAVQRQPDGEMPAAAPSPLEEVSPGPEMPRPLMAEPEPESPPLPVRQEVSPQRPGAAPAVQRQPDGEMPSVAAPLAQEAPAGAETPTPPASDPPRLPLSHEASLEPRPPAQQPLVQRRIEPDLQSGSTSEPEAGLEGEILARAESGTRLPLSEPLRSARGFEAEGRRFEAPERLVLPERRLPPLVQAMPSAQTTLLPRTRVQARFEDQATEAVSPSPESAPGRMDAGRVETGRSQILSGELPLPPPPRASSAGLIQRQPSALAPDVAVSSQRLGVVQRAQEGEPAASALPVEEEPELELDHLARQIYPLIKRMLAVERERRPVR
jgi:hypothetical protein